MFLWLSRQPFSIAQLREIRGRVRYLENSFGDQSKDSLKSLEVSYLLSMYKKVSYHEAVFSLVSKPVF
jgi:hypothetical protein